MSVDSVECDVCLYRLSSHHQLIQKKSDYNLRSVDVCLSSNVIMLSLERGQISQIRWCVFFFKGYNIVLRTVTSQGQISQVRWCVFFSKCYYVVFRTITSHGQISQICRCAFSFKCSYVFLRLVNLHGHTTGLQWVWPLPASWRKIVIVKCFFVLHDWFSLNVAAQVRLTNVQSLWSKSQSFPCS